MVYIAVYEKKMRRVYKRKNEYISMLSLFHYFL